MSESSKVAVLLCGYGEVETYSEFADYNERALRLLASKFIAFPEFVIPWIAKALEFTDRREWQSQDQYQSPHNPIFEAQRAGIETALQKQFGDRVSVFKAFNFCEPHLPHQVLQQIRDQGYDKLVIFPLLVVDSVYTTGLALQQVNEALGEDHGWVTGMRYFPSFYDCPDYHQRMADHIEARLSELQGSYAPSQIGIILLNHGSPSTADSKGHETGIRESVALYLSVRERLISRYPLITLGWMNHDTPGRWTIPDMDQAAKNLMQIGARALVFAPIGFATENHETMLDVGYAIKRYKQQVECLHLDCLNDDPVFLEMAAGWVSPLVADLLGEQQVDLHPLLQGHKTLAGTLPNRNRDLHEHLPEGDPGHHHHGNGHSHAHPHLPGVHHHH